MAKKKKQMPPIELPPFLLASDKRTVILRAALIRFLTDGYSETSMDSVTEEAGVSKATVYAHFASKQVLFETLMQEGSASAFAEFPPLIRGADSPENELLNFFRPVLHHILVKGGYAWSRLVIAEAVRHPEIARIFFDLAITRLISTVQNYIEALQTEGGISKIDTHLAAEMLLSIIVVGPLHETMILGPQPEDGAAKLRLGIQLFLKGIAAG